MGRVRAAPVAATGATQTTISRHLNAMHRMGAAKHQRAIGKTVRIETRDQIFRRAETECYTREYFNIFRSLNNLFFKGDSSQRNIHINPLGFKSHGIVGS